MTTNQTKQQFEQDCQQHDWHYEHSDDHRIWLRGSESHQKLIKGKESHRELQEIYDQYNPYHQINYEL